ncbi:hypothetical protein [Scytonema sp. NUACC26]
MTSTHQTISIAEIYVENPSFAQHLQGHLSNFEYKKIFSIIT